MILKGISTDSFVVLFLKPLANCVFDIANTIQISEVLLKFVPIWCHVLRPVVVSNHLLVRNRFEYYWLPREGFLLYGTH